MDLLKSITLYHFFTEHFPPRCRAVILPVKYRPPDLGIRAVRASAESWFQRHAISGRMARRDPGVCPRSLRSPGRGCHAFCWLICRGLVGVVRISFQSDSGSWSMNWVMGSVSNQMQNTRVVLEISIGKWETLRMTRLLNMRPVFSTSFACLVHWCLMPRTSISAGIQNEPCRCERRCGWDRSGHKRCVPACDALVMRFMATTLPFFARTEVLQ